MQKKEKIITSHRFRVNKANAYVAKLPEKISIFDREAIVEFYLLEDIVKLYEYRLKIEECKNVTTRAGLMAKERNIQKFKAIINVFTSAIEVAWAQINSGNFRSVWKAIPEHQLMWASNNVKNLPVLRALAVDLLKDISEEAIEAQKHVDDSNNDLNNIEDHEANVRAVYDLPTPEEISQIIENAEMLIPDEKSQRKSKPNSNL